MEIKRNFPTSYESVHPLFNKVKLQLERRFDLCLQQRLVQKEANTKNIASNVWLLVFFMPAEGQISEKNTPAENRYRRRLWDYIKPWFTVKGSTEYSTAIEPEFIGR